MKFDDAEKSFRAALEAAREPSRKAEVFVWLARLSLSRRSQALRDEKAPEAAGYLAAAQQSVAEAVKLAPENASVALMDAQLANLSGDKDKAVELRKRAAASPAVAALLFRDDPRTRRKGRGDRDGVARRASGERRGPERRGRLLRRAG